VTLGLDLRVLVVLDSELRSERNSGQYPKYIVTDMDHYSILDPGLPATPPQVPRSARIGLTRDLASSEAAVEALAVRAEVEPRGELASSRMRVLREDHATSLAELAESDLDAILQLLAERAEYITNATGAAIALRDGEEMVCRASAGSSAPVLGARLRVNSGLSGESIRTGQTLRCDDAENDARVNRESCRSLGIASVVVMPLVYEREVGGVFELFSDQPYAFSERDLDTLERLGDMVHTALQHADAAVANPGVVQVEAEPLAEKPAQTASAEVREPAPALPKNNPQLNAPKTAPIFHASTKPAKVDAGVGKVEVTREPAKAAAEPVLAGSAVTPRKSAVVSELAHIGKCETCGFPVSEGRKLCLDCERRQGKAQSARGPAASASGPVASAPGSGSKEVPSVAFSPQFMGGGIDDTSDEGPGIPYNRYFTAVVVVITLLVIAFLLSHRS
jgi:putative methionine-R-sulfoxide reductase with GAF domain